MLRHQSTRCSPSLTRNSRRYAADSSKLSLYSLLVSYLIKVYDSVEGWLHKGDCRPLILLYLAAIRDCEGANFGIRSLNIVWELDNIHRLERNTFRMNMGDYKEINPIENTNYADM